MGLGLAVLPLKGRNGMHPLIEAVHEMQRRSADVAGPEAGSLVDRVNAHCAAVDAVEAVLREEFSDRELVRLCRVLVGMHADSLWGDDADAADRFLESLD